MTRENAHLLAALVRGVCGGCMFALPLLYTMETWWLGYTLSTGRTLGSFAVILLLCAMLNWVSGYREEDGLWFDLGDALTAGALGIVLSAFFLLVLGELGPGSGDLPGLRQVVVLAIPLSVGVSISRSLLPFDEADQEAAFEERPLASRVVTSLAGALLLGLSAAPTEEIRQIATRAGPLHLLGMAGATLALTGGTIFLARFPGRVRHATGLHAFGETFFVYACGLVASAGLLGLVGYLEGQDAPGHLLAMVVALALPATLGAAVARLVL